MVFEYVTSGQVLSKAGANVNVATVFGFTSGQRIELYTKEAQDFVNSETKVDWVTNRASAEFSGAVAAVVGSLAAIDLIVFDMSGYTSRGEATTMINVNYDKVRKGIAFLKEADHKKKMGVS